MYVFFCILDNVFIKFHDDLSSDKHVTSATKKPKVWFLDETELSELNGKRAAIS